MNLDPSLAYTALLEHWPRYADGSDDGGTSVVNALSRAMSAANPLNRDIFAQGWIAAERARAEVVDAEITDDTVDPLVTISADLCRLADTVERFVDAWDMAGHGIREADR